MAAKHQGPHPHGAYLLAGETNHPETKHLHSTSKFTMYFLGHHLGSRANPGIIVFELFSQVAGMKTQGRGLALTPQRVIREPQTQTPGFRCTRSCVLEMALYQNAGVIGRAVHGGGVSFVCLGPTRGMLRLEGATLGMADR